MVSEQEINNILASGWTAEEVFCKHLNQSIVFAF